MIGKWINNSAGNSNIQIVWLTTTDRIPDSLPPEQENLVAAIWSSILLTERLTPTILMLRGYANDLLRIRDARSILLDL